MVYKQSPNCSNSQNQDYTLQMVEVIEKSNTNSLGQVITAKLVDMCSPSGYISFNVTKAAIRWIEQRLNIVELNLTIKCMGSSQCDLSPEHQVRFSTNSKIMQVPHLVIKTYAHVTSSQSGIIEKRKKRSSTPTYNFCPNTTQTCCLRRLKVNFTRDLNWTFIIAPQSMYINYCEGLCLLGTGSIPPQIEVVNGIHSNSSFNPCCSGAEYETQTLLVAHDIANFSLVEFPKMTAKSCRCG